MTGCTSLVNMQYSTWQRSLLPGLRQAGLCVISDSKELSEEQKTYVDHYFMENVYPVLTPMAVDSSRPFPLIVNKTLNLGALLKKKGEKDAELEFATVQVPSVLPRIIVHSGRKRWRKGSDPSGRSDRRKHGQAVLEL